MAEVKDGPLTMEDIAAYGLPGTCPVCGTTALQMTAEYRTDRDRNVVHELRIGHSLGATCVAHEPTAALLATKPVKYEPLTEQELDAIERDEGYDERGDDTLRLVAEVRRLRAEIAKQPPTSRCQCGAERSTYDLEWRCPFCGSTVDVQSGMNRS